MPAARRRSSGRRSQPPRPTRSRRPRSPATRSSLTRPSRTWTTRSARSADAGSWLTTSAVPPSSRDQLGDQVEHLARGGGVELARRLVRDQELRAAGEGRAERDPLLLAAGELARMSVAACRPGRRARAARPARASRLRPGLAGEAELHADELTRGQLAGERPPVVLVGVADRARAEAGRPPSDRAVRRRCRRRSPSRRRAGRSPATIRSSVDLPEPLGPRTTHSSPGCTVRVRPCSAATPPSADG